MSGPVFERFLLGCWDRPLETLVRQLKAGSTGEWNYDAVDVVRCTRDHGGDLGLRDMPMQALDAAFADTNSNSLLNAAIPVSADIWRWGGSSQIADKAGNVLNINGMTISTLCGHLNDNIDRLWTNYKKCPGPRDWNPFDTHHTFYWTPRTLWCHPRSIKWRCRQIIADAGGESALDVAKAKDLAWRYDNDPSLVTIRIGGFVVVSPDVELDTSPGCRVKPMPKSATPGTRLEQIHSDEPTWVLQLKDQLRTIELALHALTWKNATVKAIHDDMWAAGNRLVLMQDVARVFAQRNACNAESQRVLGKANALLASHSWQILLTSPEKTVAPTLLGERMKARDTLLNLVRHNPTYDTLISKLVTKYPNIPAPAPSSDRTWIDVIDDLKVEVSKQLSLADGDGKWAIEIDVLTDPSILDASAPVTTNALTALASYAKKAKTGLGFVPSMITTVMVSRITKEGADIKGQQKWKVILEEAKTKILKVAMTKEEFDAYDKQLDRLLHEMHRHAGDPAALKKAQKDFKSLVAGSQAEGGLKPAKFTSAKWTGVMAIFNVFGLLAAVDKGADSAKDFCSLIGATESSGRAVLTMIDAWKPGGSLGKVFLDGTERISKSFGAVLGILTGAVQIADGLRNGNNAAVVAGTLTAGGATMTVVVALLESNPITAAIGYVGGALMLIATFIDTDDSPPPAQEYLTHQFERTVDVDWAHGTTSDYNGSRQMSSRERFGLRHFREALDKDATLFGLYKDFYAAVKDKANRAAFKAPGCPDDARGTGNSVNKYYPAEKEALQSLGVTNADTDRMLRGH